MGGAVAGATGLTAIASDAKAASTDNDAEAATKDDDVEVAAKANDVEVVAAYGGGSGSYRIIIPDPDPNFTDKENGDSVKRRANTTKWTGFVDDGIFGTASDDAHYDNVSGTLTRSDVTEVSGDIKVRRNSEIIYP